MLENPRPILMKHWLTIGALDPEEWKVHLGGYWRQRAGRLLQAKAQDSEGALASPSRNHPRTNLQLKSRSSWKTSLEQLV